MRFRLYFFFLFLLLASSRTGWGQDQQKADSLFPLLLAMEQQDTTYLVLLYEFVSNDGNYETRIPYAIQGITLAKALGETLLEARFEKQLADSYRFLGDLSAALDHYKKALTIFQRGTHYENHEANCLNAIGLVYMSQENYVQAKNVFTQTLAINSRRNISANYGADLLNLGEIYRLNQEYDSAYILFDSARIIFVENNFGENYEAYALGNMGLVQVARNRVNEGLSMIDSATRVLTRYRDGFGIASYNSALAEELIELGRYKEANQVLQVALSTAQEYNLREQIRDSYKLLAEVLAEEGRYQEAYQHQREYIAYKDSLTDEAVSEQAAELRADYTIEQNRLKNQLELEAVEAESRFRGTLAWVMGLGFSAIGILALFMVIFNRRQQLANTLLEEQKERIELKSEIIAQKNEEITSSIEYASRIQRAMLPYRDKLRSAFGEHFVLYKPRDIVSGDFYWMQEVGDEMLLAVADCTGHGVPGALMSMLGMSILDELTVGQGITDPGLLLARLHEEIMRQLKQETSQNRDGMDISIISYHKPTQTIRLAGAKQTMVYVTENPKENKPWVHQVKGDRIFVGGALNVNRPVFSVNTLDIDQPLWLYLFSDGYQDQFGGPENKKFRPAAFRELLLEANSLTGSEQCQLLDSTFEAWKGNEEQLDDVLVVGLRLG